jgi:hypothetical protein
VPAATRIRPAQPVLAMMSLCFDVDQNIFVDEGFDLEFMTMRTDLAIAALGNVMASEKGLTLLTF